MRWSNIPVLKNLPYFFRKRIHGKKMVVFESDDWGMQRTPHQQALDFVQSQVGTERLTRWTYDSLEHQEDVEALGELMALYANAFQSLPRITANFILANPVVREDGKLTYVPFSEAIHQAIEHPEKAWRDAIAQGWLYPQLHGYCHFNRAVLEQVAQTPVGRAWAQNGALTMLATVKGQTQMLPGEYLASVADVVSEFKLANDTFSAFFGFTSKSLIPPRYGINKEALSALHACGLEILQASSNLCNEHHQRHLFIWGRKHQGILMIPRNVRLDPYPEYGYYAKQAIAAIETCFRMGIPACVDMHRVNFSSRFQPGQRDRFLEELHVVLTYLKVHHPETTFLTTPELLSAYA